MGCTAVQVVDGFVLRECLASQRARLRRKIELVRTNWRWRAECSCLWNCWQFTGSTKRKTRFLSRRAASVCFRAVGHDLQDVRSLQRSPGPRELLKSSIAKHAHDELESMERGKRVGVVEKGNVVWRKRRRVKGPTHSPVSSKPTASLKRNQTNKRHKTTLGPSERYAEAGIGNYPRYLSFYFNCSVGSPVASLRC